MSDLDVWEESRERERVRDAAIKTVAQAVGWCGCGDQQRIESLMLAYLETLDLPSGETPEWPDPDAAPDATFLLAYIADQLEWTEHGTTIRYPWLTDLGRAALAGLRARVTTPVTVTVAPEADVPA